MMMPTKLLLLLAIAAIALPACSSSESDDTGASEGAATTTTITVGRTRSFTGSFGVRGADGDAELDFEVSNIDWEARTASWNSKVVSGRSLTDDVGLRAEIVLARCPGCFSVVVRERGEEAVRATVSSGRLTSLRYFGLGAVDLRLDTASDSPASGEEAAPLRAGAGACTLSCDGQVSECKDDRPADECDAAIFSRIPYCPSGIDVAFRSGRRCAAR
jgi:hypothetical protein